MVKFFSPNTRQMMSFLNPLDPLIPKIPFSFFCRILGPGHLWGLGVSLGWDLGGPSIEGGSNQRAASTPPPPPELKAGSPHPPGHFMLTPVLVHTSGD